MISNLTNVQWRVRESSCVATSDFLRGRSIDGVVDFLPQFWETLFRVLDDIKESVRKAAELACRTLSKVRSLPQTLFNLPSLQQTTHISLYFRRFRQV